MQYRQRVGRTSASPASVGGQTLDSHDRICHRVTRPHAASAYPRRASPIPPVPLSLRRRHRVPMPRVILDHSPASPSGAARDGPRSTRRAIPSPPTSPTPTAPIPSAGCAGDAEGTDRRVSTPPRPRPTPRPDSAFRLLACSNIPSVHNARNRVSSHLRPEARYRGLQSRPWVLTCDLATPFNWQRDAFRQLAHDCNRLVSRLVGPHLTACAGRVSLKRRQSGNRVTRTTARTF